MTDARIFAALGSVCAALLATWVGYALYQGLTYKPVHFSDPSDLWLVFGVPAALAAAGSTFLLTREDSWIRRPLRLRTLISLAIRTAALACLFYIPIQVIWSMAIAVTHFSNATSASIHIGDLIFLVYTDFVVLAFGFVPAVAVQMLALFFGWSMVPDYYWKNVDKTQGGP